MTKQIYVILASMLLCIILWFSLSVAILYFTKTIQKIDSIYATLWWPVSCQSLPYGIQDKIEQMSHTLSEDTTCNPK